MSPNTVEKCRRCFKDFLMIEQEQRFYVRKKLPNPTECPDCRQRARLSLRNERHLYKRTCDRCKASIISTYAANSEFIVYCQKCFWEHLG